MQTRQRVHSEACDARRVQQGRPRRPEHATQARRGTSARSSKSFSIVAFFARCVVSSTLIRCFRICARARREHCALGAERVDTWRRACLSAGTGARPTDEKGRCRCQLLQRLEKGDERRGAHPVQLLRLLLLLLLAQVLQLLLQSPEWAALVRMTSNLASILGVHAANSQLRSHPSLQPEREPANVPVGLSVRLLHTYHCTQTSERPFTSERVHACMRPRSTSGS
eukprot:6157713-Pleurochrysis_carterae.AAC.1